MHSSGKLPCCDRGRQLKAKGVDSGLGNLSRICTGMVDELLHSLLYQPCTNELGMLKLFTNQYGGCTWVELTY